MSNLSIDQWLEEYVPIAVQVTGKPEFTVDVDIAALGITLYEATDTALEAAAALETPEAREAARIAAHVRLFSRLVKGWSFAEPPSPETLTRLGERTLMRIWTALQEAILPNAGNSAGLTSGSAEAPAAAPGGGASSS